MLSWSSGVGKTNQAESKGKADKKGSTANISRCPKSDKEICQEIGSVRQEFKGKKSFAKIKQKRKCKIKLNNETSYS